jgi:hypothetical protein
VKPGSVPVGNRRTGTGVVLRIKEKRLEGGPGSMDVLKLKAVVWPVAEID